MADSNSPAPSQDGRATGDPLIDDPVAGGDPAATPTEQTLLASVRAATAAPSVHNSQPWLFRIQSAGGSGCVEVFADRRRRLEVIDPLGREMLISVGAALFTLRLALAERGWTSTVTLFPDPDAPDLVARVSTVGRASPGKTLTDLAAAVPHRHTNRLPFRSAVIPTPVQEELFAAAETEGAVLTVADAVVRTAILGLVRTAEQHLRAEGVYRAELHEWTRPARGRRDGVPLAAFGPWDAVEALPLRDFGLTLPHLQRPLEPFELHPTIAVLSTVGDGNIEWVRSGQALQRVLLAATMRGLAATPMSQPLEIPALREMLTDTTSGRWAQLILRLGFAPPTSPAPRRPLADVLLPPG
jgi:nitroreductase